MSDAPLPLLKPDLYESGAEQESECRDGQEPECRERRSAGAATHDTPTLRGGRCECGHVFFPMQTFGCERCGRSGTALQVFSLTGRGRLRAAATVHIHADEKRKTPFVIGTIALDDGPIVRTLLLDPPADRDAPGTRVEAMLVPVETAELGHALDLRFRPVRA